MSLIERNSKQNTKQSNPLDFARGRAIAKPQRRKSGLEFCDENIHKMQSYKAKNNADSCSKRNRHSPEKGFWLLGRPNDPFRWPKLKL